VPRTNAVEIDLFRAPRTKAVGNKIVGQYEIDLFRAPRTKAVLMGAVAGNKIIGSVKLIWLVSQL
jgi:hypothetical protein